MFTGVAMHIIVQFNLCNLAYPRPNYPARSLLELRLGGRVGCSLEPRRGGGEKSAWYPLFAHALNFREIKRALLT